MTRNLTASISAAIVVVCGTVFAYNGGYENSLDYSAGPYDGCAGYGNYTLTAREESGTTIAANKYAQCKKLTSVNLSNVTSIGDAAFAYSALTSVTIPSTVTSMGFIAFGGCTNLTSLTVSNFNWYDAAKEPFRDCTKLMSLTAKCAPPSINASAFNALFPNVTAVRVPKANMTAWQNKKYTGVTIKDADANAYTIRYHEGCGANRFVEMDYNVGATVALPALGTLGWSYAGHVFLGWAKSADSGIPVYVNCEKGEDFIGKGRTLDLYAVWAASEDVYRIKFNKNDGTGASYTFAYERDVVRSLTWIGNLGWSYKGHVFLGWAKSPTATAPAYVNGEKLSNVVDPGKTLVLYAIWADESNVYRIKFEKNDGSGATYTFVYERDIQRSLTWIGNLGWTNPGKTFLGWAKVSTASAPVYVNGEKITNLAATGKVLTLYALWADSSNVYRIKFDKNDGSGTSYTFVYVRDVPRKLTWIGNLGWSRSGYSFKGWSLNSGAATGTWTNGQEVNNLADVGKTVTIYAIWKSTAACISAGSVKTVTTDVKPGYYSGVIGEGVFSLLVDYDGSAFFAIESEEGISVCYATVKLSSGTIMVLTEDGEVYAVDEEGGAYIATNVN